MTGISAVAVLGYKNQERYTDTGDTSVLREIVFRHIFSVGLQCPANDELSMIKVKDFLHYLKFDLGWNIVGVSCDGYQSLMLLQSLKLDGFNVKEISMDIIKNNECVGYTIFRNTLLEQRIKILKISELIRELTNLEKNQKTGAVDHPRQSIKILDDGTKVKSVGKDISDSLGGAIYNATLSVNLDELDYMGNVTLTADTSGLVTLNPNENVADRYFSFVQNNKYQTVDLTSEDKLEDSINNELERNQQIIQKIKNNNKETTLTDEQLLNMYNNINGSDFIII